MERKKVVTIHPLGEMQKSLLLHRLMNKTDQGFLHVQCLLEGPLDIEVLKKSWHAAIKRHEVLRTTVHWEKVKNPVQIVHEHISANWEIIDRSNENPDEFKVRLKHFKSNPKRQAIDFEKGPLRNLHLIKTQENKYFLIWNCHHLLLDGWSTSIIYKDVFTFYENFKLGKKTALESIPTQKAYQDQLADQTEHRDVEHHWKNVFASVGSPSIFNSDSRKTSSNYKIQEEIFPDALLEGLISLTKAYKVTQNTILQGIWSLLLGKYFNKNQMVFGNTVSGRSSGLVNIEHMTGMFMNVIPVTTSWTIDTDVTSFFKNLQDQQIKSRRFEHITTGEIEQFINWSNKLPLFDNLFIFENFPWNEIESAGVLVKDFGSGVTSTYPVTMVIRTIDGFAVQLISDTAVISTEIADWLLRNFKKLLQIFINQSHQTIEENLSQIERLDFSIKKDKTTIKKGNENFGSARNNTELELLKIWESLFEIRPISIYDNFFDIGGKSLHALKLFSAFDQKLGIKIPPQVLFENPTIASLGVAISNENIDKKWNYLIPLRGSGTKSPVFCIHGGGGHVFFFEPLASVMNKNRPVYALQPAGIDSENELHTSIEEMAFAYADEILKVQSNGPFHIITYCFSTGVGIEIAHYLKQKGHECKLFIVDSIIDQENFNDTARLKSRIQGFFKRIAQNPVLAIKLAVRNKLSRFVESTVTMNIGNEYEKRLSKVQNNLIRIYNAYPWNKKNIADTYLLLTKKETQFINDQYRMGWQAISEKEVHLSYLNGRHDTIFNEGNVLEMAQKIEANIADK